MTKYDGHKKRDFIGFANKPPSIQWPENARIAISLVVNYEEGSEQSFALGDNDQELLTEWGAYPFPKNIRNLAMESMFEYGSRVGIWRLLELFDQFDIKSTFFACAQAFENNPRVAEAFSTSNHDLCSHGWRWEEVFRLSRDEEADHIQRAINSFNKTCGQRPSGWYCRYGPSINTRELLVEEGNFLYDCDSYNDDSPFFVDVLGKKHLVIPYTPDVNDFSFWIAPGFVTSDHFFHYLKDTFDTLYAEGQNSSRLMSIGLHPRMIGRPGRILGLRRFLEYATKFPDAWFATRKEIATHWHQNHKISPLSKKTK